jgi:hypothetical protein
MRGIGSLFVDAAAKGFLKRSSARELENYSN